MARETEHKKEQVSQELEQHRDDIQEKVEELGLNPRPVRYWINDNDEVNQLAAYGGFTKRYPHWRWGMKYDRQQKQGEYGGGKIFEMVVNSDPCHAYLQMSNDVVDQKAVIAHVEAHSDFFENNEWFQDSPNAVDMLANHAEQIESYMEDPDIDGEEVEKWIDTILTLEDNIDQYTEYIYRQNVDVGVDFDSDESSVSPENLDISENIKEEVFNDDVLDSPEPHKADNTTKDILGFLISEGMQYDSDREMAVEYEDWQLDILDMIREESYYFAPQKMTKVINEGHACVAPDTLVVTENGLLPMEEVVQKQNNVSDGNNIQKTTASHIIENRESVNIQTKWGYTLSGSADHRIKTEGGEWKEMQELEVGDNVKICRGNNIWSSDYVSFDWESSTDDYSTLEDVAEEAGYSQWTVLEYKQDGSISDEASDKIETAMDKLDYNENNYNRYSNAEKINVPEKINEDFAEFLGMLAADGHINSDGKEVGFTYGKKYMAEKFKQLVSSLFDVECKIWEDGEKGERWRCVAYSTELSDLIVENFDFIKGESSDKKPFPNKILRSPQSVVESFISALISCDGYAGEQGIIYSTKSEDIADKLHLALLNFGIISNRRQANDGCYRLSMNGSSISKFVQEIGLIDEEKQERAEEFINSSSFVKEKGEVDEIVEKTKTKQDVYDITVSETHQYEAGAFINHNSYWESMVMTDEEFADTDEIVDYADQHSRVIQSRQMNPYRLGKFLWEHLENSVNRREVVDKLLRVGGVSPDNFHKEIDFDYIHEQLSHPDSDDVVKRNYSLGRLHNKGFIRNINLEQLRKINRYIVDRDRYESVSEALEEVDYSRGWERMRQVRETHNDAMFIDEFMTQEFVDEEDYFAYEYRTSNERFEVASTDVEDVKKKLLIQMTNFGKPTVEVVDGNYDNTGELLLLHRYNGIVLDKKKAEETLSRLFELWGRPVNLITVGKYVPEEELDYSYSEGVEPQPEEIIMKVRYDGKKFEEFEVDEARLQEEAKADEIDYKVVPEEWKG